MTTIQHKGNLILAHEEQFANKLAWQVLEKPRLSVWMILIPIIIIYYLYHHQRFTQGRREFVRNYLRSRSRSLREAMDAIQNKRDPDPETIVTASNLPAEAIAAYHQWIVLLLEHYRDLLENAGEDFPSLVQSAYGSETNYVLTMNRLNLTEQHLNEALKPHLTTQYEGVGEIILKIETASERLRREVAERIFRR